MAWYGNVYSGGGNLYYYPNGRDSNSRVYIDSWNAEQTQAAYAEMNSNQADSANWNQDFAKISKLYNSVMAQQYQNELAAAQVEATNSMAEAYAKETPALEPLKRAAEVVSGAKSETDKNLARRASLLSQFNRKGYSQGKAATLGG